MRDTYTSEIYKNTGVYLTFLTTLRKKHPLSVGRCEYSKSNRASCQVRFFCYRPVRRKFGLQSIRSASSARCTIYFFFLLPGFLFFFFPSSLFSSNERRTGVQHNRSTRHTKPRHPLTTRPALPSLPVYGCAAIMRLLVQQDGGKNYIIKKKLQPHCFFVHSFI